MRRPRVFGIVACVVSLLFLMLLGGCGGGGGGGQPGGGPQVIGGGQTTIIGQVVDATNVTSPIPDAYVYVPLSPPTQPSSHRALPSQVIAYDITDQQGNYRLQNVPGGTLTMVVEPCEGSEFNPLQFDFTAPDSGVLNVRLTLLPTSISVSAIQVSPQSAQLQVGGTQQFTATWAVIGPVGTVNESGLFTATAAGDGRVVAVIGPHLDSASVTVSSVTQAYTFVTKWDLPAETEWGWFPYGITVGASNVYVAYVGLDWVKKFTSDGVLLDTWTRALWSPYDVAADANGNVYVIDWMSYKVRKLASDGTEVVAWGSQGNANGQFQTPSGIGVDSDGNVYVSDAGINCIQKFTSDGTFITRWGSSGSGDGQFDEPGGIAVDASGNVYVTDLYNYRIQKFTSDGAFLGKWGSNGSADGQFSEPSDVAVDSTGNVYVADWGNHRVQKFATDGSFVTKWGSQGTGDGQFLYPDRIAVDAAGNVYVTDTRGHRVQKFRPGP